MLFLPESCFWLCHSPSCEGVLAHMLFVRASFPIWKVIPVLDPLLTGLFGSPGRWCLRCTGRILDKRHCVNKGHHSHCRVHSASEVCSMPCPLSSCLLALKSPLCSYPGAPLFWSSCSQINWTGAFEILSSFPNLLILQAFYKLFSLLGKENRKRHHLEWQLLGPFISSAFLLKGPPARQVISSETSPTLWWLDAGLSESVALATISACCQFGSVLDPHRCLPLCLTV